jgi:hypothetical protein
MSIDEYFIEDNSPASDESSGSFLLPGAKALIPLNPIRWPALQMII